MSDELVVWLRVQLDEVERVARAADTHEWYESSGQRSIAFVSQADGEHIALHDPARALRWVESVRRILVAWEEDGAWWPGGAAVPGLLAQPFADRPGYREEWRP